MYVHIYTCTYSKINMPKRSRLACLNSCMYVRVYVCKYVYICSNEIGDLPGLFILSRLFSFFLCLVHLFFCETVELKAMMPSMHVCVCVRMYVYADTYVYDHFA
jgi:hypothetical protein